MCCWNESLWSQLSECMSIVVYKFKASFHVLHNLNPHRDIVPAVCPRCRAYTTALCFFFFVLASEHVHMCVWTEHVHFGPQCPTSYY